ncbi:Ig-like domain-containing protein [Neobacillus sp. WH10]|uniref:Ig-like domain-containing protein n=1 Tax=Neobacillus sp. WH10 TaxID=3047873 RepID=UPI0024C18CEA|nr:Ig-like domain-containing protein [Neobacillus sp. WH10]WHY77094.1 Ig-like domain-containing protein [Neobacillus sp. WH10]
MKFNKILSLVIAAAVITTSPGITTFAETTARDNSEIVSTINNELQRTISFNDDWKFNLGDVAGAKEKVFDDSEWRKLTLPHDWSIELDFNKDSPGRYNGGYLDGGTGWYRKSFVLPKEMEGKKISINFGGVYMDSYVYVNGKQVGNNPYGYTPFSFDITKDLICDGITENVIAVKATNQQPSSRWYSGSGIYRDVSLTVTENVHVAEYGTYVTTPDLENEYKQGRAKVNIKTDIMNEESTDKEVSVKSVILDAKGNSVAENVTTEVVSAGATKKFNADVTVENPILWGTENPYLYKVATTVIIDNKIVDEYKTDFGIRWFDMTPNNGFFLNGKQMKLQGVSMHHDQGALGAVDNKTSIRRQVKKLKEMGVNSIRVTHNPASQHLIDSCNEEGILLIEEAFDTWYGGKNPYDYGRFFEQKSIHGDMTWAEHDLKQMINRGKNAPSIMMWSLGNEIWETSQAKGLEVAKNLQKWVKEIDTTRPTTMGEIAFMGNEGAHENVADIIDVVGFNYAEHNYDKYKEKYEDWVMYGSETSSAVRSRGVYAHPEKIGIGDNHPDLQQSSYDNDRVAWGKTAEASWKMNRDREYILGEYIWTGFDYIGEPTPYYGKFPSKSSYFGAIDTAGFEKDAFYFYQSQWSDEPMVHLLPHWNWENDDSIKVDGDKILVYAYTNANSVDLYFNEDVTSTDLGELIESKGYQVTDAGYNDRYKETKDGKLHLEFRVPYKPGKLTAVAKDENGKVVARDVVKTANDAKKIDLSADRQVITADGYDLSFITVDVTDENGTLVPNADNLINFDVKGNGKIVGVDNGNAATAERYKDNKRKAFNGKALVIVQSTKNAGSFTLTATSPGISSDNTTVYTVPGEELSENKILGYDVSDVTVPINGELKLPEKVTGIYSDGSKKEVDVMWDSVPEDALKTPGIFKVNGTVAGSNISVNIKVIVKAIIGVLDSRMLVPVGKQAKLPEKVSVVSNDGSIEKYPVTWERELTAEDVDSAKTVTIEGMITGVESLKAKAIVVVSDNFKEANIALNEGKAYPRAFDGFSLYDSVNNINDGIVSKVSSPKNRWTNWGKPGQNYDEYVGIEFNEEYSISKIGISLYTDGGVAIPSEILVEYWNGNEWLGVSNQSKTTGFSAEGTEEITFDEVDTTQIRTLLKEDTVANKAVGITEFYIYSNVVESEGTALLSDIKVNDASVEGFNENTNQYAINLPYASKVPVVTATAKDTASVFVVPALNVDSNATVMVTAEDGKTNSYIVNFSEGDPQLTSATIELSKKNIIEDDIVDIIIEGTLEDDSSIDKDQIQAKYNISSKDSGEAKIENGKLYAYTEGTVILNAEVTYKGKTVSTEDIEINIGKNPAEKTIISYEKVNVETNKGVAPILPEKVKAIYDIGLPREVKVTWDNVKEDSYNKYGVFEVEGTVEGQALKAKAKVVVKGLSAVQNVSLATNVKVEPKLPQTVKAYYTDGTIVDLPVTWEDYDKELLSKVGTFAVNGTVEGTDKIVNVSIRVTDVTVKGINFAGTRVGFDLAMAIASYTHEPFDSIKSVNDEMIDNKRWTNWADASRRSGDWVGVIFGTDVPEDKYINNLEVNFFEDHGCSLPESFEIQYYVGDKVVLPNKPGQVLMEPANPFNDDSNWVTVSNLVSNPEITSPTDTNYYTFEMVKTKALRIKMKAKTGKGLAIREMQAFEQRVVQNPDFVVNGIKVNGKDLESFASDRYNYTMKLKANEDLPEIIVDATNNASSSVVYTVSNSEKLDVIVKSENGLKEVKYGITLEREVEEDEVGKAALKIAIDYADEVAANGGLEGVVPAVVKEFNESLAQAKEVYGNHNATEVEVDAAFKRLVNSIWMLEFKQGNKEVLQTLVDSAKALVEKEYTSDSWANLQRALGEAEGVLADENAKQKEVDKALNNLKTAIDALVKKNINKTDLQNLVNMVGGLNKDKYIKSTWNKFEKALNDAKKVLGNEDATQVDKAYNNLLKSYLDLKLVPDKSALEDLINKVKNMDLSKYTKESVTMLKKELKNAEKVLKNKEATQQEVVAATKTLNLALANLAIKNSEHTQKKQ